MAKGKTPAPKAPVWMSQLTRKITSGGGMEFLKTISNVQIMLENFEPLQHRIAYDEFSNKVVALVPMPWDMHSTDNRKYPREWTDSDRANLLIMVEKLLNIQSANPVDTAFTAVTTKNAFHPIRDYLTGLEWDKVRRLDTLFIDYLGVADTDYARAVTRKAFVAAVRRVMRPGVKFDTMLILTGPQGGYKSTILRLMGEPWFSDSLRSFEGKDAMEAMQGVWIMEVGELEAMRRSEVTAVKAFLSKTSDRYRAAYGRFTGTYPRQCVLFGTTNSLSFLRDPTGGRRFFPLQTDAQLRTKSVADDLENERDQLWAEAVVWEKGGEPIYLQRSEIVAAATIEQERYREPDPWEAIIQEFVDRPVPQCWDTPKWLLAQRQMYWNNNIQGEPPPTEERRRVCAHEIWCEAMGKQAADMRQVDSRRINAILENLPGWMKQGQMPPGCPYGRQRAFLRQVGNSPMLPPGEADDTD